MYCNYLIFFKTKISYLIVQLNSYFERRVSFLLLNTHLRRLFVMHGLLDFKIEYYLVNYTLYKKG